MEYLFPPQKVNISFERFSAIKPVKNEIPKIQYRNMRLAGADHDKYIIATAGNKASHVGVIKIAKRKNYKKILILEDVVVFHPKADRIFDDAIKQLENIEWDMLYLGCHHRKPFELITPNIAKITQGHAIHAYILKTL